MIKQGFETAAKAALATLAVLAAGASAPAAAAQADADADATAGWYVAGSVGRAANRVDHERVRTGLAFGGITTGGGMTTQSIDDNDRSTGARLYGGYRFGRHLAVEGGYFDLGRLGFTAHTTPAGSFTSSLKIRGLALNAVGTLPLVGELSAFGRAGLVASRARDRFSRTGAVVVLQRASDASGLGYNAGLGLAYRLTPALSVRLEGERFRVKDGVGRHENLDLLSLGLVYRFGGTP